MSALLKSKPGCWWEEYQRNNWKLELEYQHIVIAALLQPKLLVSSTRITISINYKITNKVSFAWKRKYLLTEKIGMNQATQSTLITGLVKQFRAIKWSSHPRFEPGLSNDARFPFRIVAHVPSVIVFVVCYLRRSETDHRFAYAVRIASMMLRDIRIIRSPELPRAQLDRLQHTLRKSDTNFLELHSTKYLLVSSCYCEGTKLSYFKRTLQAKS